MAEQKHWLFKSEPSSYSFSDLLSARDQTTEWGGVRSYQARNFMRDETRRKWAKVCCFTTAAPI
jgi:predicted RNA-binding protein with PUA-like domain